MVNQGDPTRQCGRDPPDPDFSANTYLNGTYWVAAGLELPENGRRAADDPIVALPSGRGQNLQAGPSQPGHESAGDLIPRAVLRHEQDASDLAAMQWREWIRADREPASIGTLAHASPGASERLEHVHHHDPGPKSEPLAADRLRRIEPERVDHGQCAEPNQGKERGEAEKWRQKCQRRGQDETEPEWHSRLVGDVDDVARAAVDGLERSHTVWTPVDAG